MMRSLHRHSSALLRQSQKSSSWRLCSSSSTSSFDLFNPTEEHAQLRTMLRSFVENEVDPQALQFNKEEKFNLPLFKRLGDLGVLGVTVSTWHASIHIHDVAWHVFMTLLF